MDKEAAMGMGKRKPVQEALFVAYDALPRSRSTSR